MARHWFDIRPQFSIVAQPDHRPLTQNSLCLLGKCQGSQLSTENFRQQRQTDVL